LANVLLVAAMPVQLLVQLVALKNYLAVCSNLLLALKTSMVIPISLYVLL